MGAEDRHHRKKAMEVGVTGEGMGVLGGDRDRGRGDARGGERTEKPRIERGGTGREAKHMEEPMMDGGGGEEGLWR